MKSLLTVIALLATLQFTRAQEQTIPFINQRPSIDGKLQEAVWQSLPSYSNFRNFIPENGSLSEQQTEVKIFHNGQSLFISAVYHDSTERTQIGSLKRDDIRNSVASSDAFVLVLDTNNQHQNAFYFACNIGGALSDALIERNGQFYNINNSWNAIWTAETSQENTRKIYEIEIPLSSIGFSENSPEFGLLFYHRDIKKNSWSSYSAITRNYQIFDLRFTKKFHVEKLNQSSTSRITLTPSITSQYQHTLRPGLHKSQFTPSLDLQYSINASLRLDATVNPDFSQIDVDQQVTNLSQFSINFPERRNFFLENSDLFSNLGIPAVNPFYSRRIGAKSDILFGAKLSGNLSPKTRLGFLDVFTKANANTSAENYGALVLEQQLNRNFSTTGFIVNHQEMDGFRFGDQYNRVAGANVNYRSDNNKWTGLANYAKSLGNDYDSANNFYHLGMWYTSNKSEVGFSAHHVQQNYLTNIGFVPRLYTYDAASQQTMRESYTQANARLSFRTFFKNHASLDSYRYFLLRSSGTWNARGQLIQSSLFFNNALWFKNLSSIYFNAFYDYNELQYAFDLLRNGNYLQPGTYHYAGVQAGYNSVRNRNFRYNASLRHGSYYHGTRSRLFVNAEYLVLPTAKFRATYEVNAIDLKALGKRTFHLLRMTNELFFSRRLNWTTYIQYNTQLNNLNINSRLQWEYLPLSYVYLVVTDNFDQHVHRTNWGVALKLNYRFNI